MFGNTKNTNKNVRSFCMRFAVYGTEIACMLYNKECTFIQHGVHAAFLYAKQNIAVILIFRSWHIF